MAIYLDHNATTPLDERVLEAMLPYLQHGFGNPSSVHAVGRAARSGLETAREQVSALVGAHPSQVIFTSGGTEANNAALKGYALGRRSGRLAISAVEHASVAAPVAALQRYGWTSTLLPVDAEGRVDPAALTASLAGGLVSVMWANNETGVVQPIAEIAEVVRECGAVLHTDAVQAAGKLPIDFTNSGVGLMSLSAHKLGGPKGAGALVVDKAIALEPLLHGGGQEQNRRGGTENLAAIVGFGRAAELVRTDLIERRRKMLELRSRFESGLQERIPAALIFGRDAERLPNTVFFAVPGIEGATLVLGLDRRGISVSSGSACGSSHREPSPVLQAMGIPSDLARCAVRVSFGVGNKMEDVTAAVTAVAAETAALQQMASSAWA